VSADAPSRPVRILYLEDDPLDVEPVEQRLEEAGITYELTIASDRREFEVAVEAGPLDLVLVDYLLPAYDGMTAMAYARSHHPGVPVILISGVIGEEQAVDCMLNGATDYVLKHHLDRLVPATRRALREAAERRARLAAEAALRVSEERYRAIFQTARESIWVLDRDGVTTLVNERAAELFGYRAGELVGRRPGECVGGERAWPPEEVASYEGSFRRKDGAVVHAIVSTGELRNAEGTLDGFVLMLTDITERKLAAAERARLTAQLQRSDRLASLGVLAGGVAHDINNVLTPILGVSSLNLRLRAEDERLCRDLQVISDAASRGREMVARMLDFARPSSQGEQVLDANELVREVVRLLERTTFSKIAIETALADGLESIRGESSALVQALMNLCVNAVDAMESGGRLCLRTRATGESTIEIEVEDSGPGIEQDVLEKISDPFFTTKEQGTGLGLSIVHNVAEAHMGAVEIDSEVGRGTRVTLRLPTVGAAGAADRVSSPNIDSEDTPVEAQETLEVYVVDDDKFVRQTVGRLIEWLGHKVVTASNGEEAVEAIEGGYRPDVVLLDMNMPGLGGIATFRRIRTLRPEIAVTIITGAFDPQLKHLAEADPRVGVLSKPFGVDALQRCLETFAQGQQPT